MLPCSNFGSSSPVFGERKRLTVFVAKDSAIFTTTWLTTNNNKFPTFWLFLKYIISCEIKARKQYPLITKRSMNSFRSHIKNSCVVFDRGLQTPRNNKSTRPTASCFHLFLGVWKPRSNTRTRFWFITWKVETTELHRVRHLFFKQIASYHGVTHGDNSEIQNAEVSKKKTSRNWKLENRFISRSSSTSFGKKFRRPCDFDFRIWWRHCKKPSIVFFHPSRRSSWGSSLGSTFCTVPVQDVLKCPFYSTHELSLNYRLHNWTSPISSPRQHFYHLGKLVNELIAYCCFFFSSLEFWDFQLPSASMENLLAFALLLASIFVAECSGACGNQSCIGGECTNLNKCSDLCTSEGCNLECTSSVRECTQDCLSGGCIVKSDSEISWQACYNTGCSIACSSGSKQCKQICSRAGCNSTCDAEKCQQDCSIQGGCNMTCLSSAKECIQDCTGGGCHLECNSSVGKCTQDCTGGGCIANINSEMFDQDCPWGGCSISCSSSSKQCNQSCSRGRCNARCDAEKCQQDCSAGGCNMTCLSSGKECIQDCPGGGCEMSCPSNVDQCTQGCPDGRCIFRCSAKKCTLNCLGSSCKISAGITVHARFCLLVFWVFGFVGVAIAF